MGRWTTRQIVLFASPWLMGAATVLHPHPPFARPGLLEFLRPRVGLWLGVHVAQLGLVLLLGISLWLLAEGLRGRAATLARLATACFLVFYASFDSVAGIGTGLLARAAAAAPAPDPAAAAALLDRYWMARFQPPLGALVAIADLSWAAAVLGAAWALRAEGAPRACFGLFVVAAIAFGIDHPFPTGTLGMLALFAALVLLQRSGMLTVEQRSLRRA